MRRFILLVVVCLLLGMLFYVYIHYSEKNTLPTIRLHGIDMLTMACIALATGIAAYFADGLMDKLISWRTLFMLRFLLGFVADVLLALGLVWLAGNYVFKYSQQEMIKLDVLLTVSIFIYEIFYGLFYSYRYYAHTQVEQLRAERWQLELQYDSLKTQISPHYLFNCLNTISSLLYKDSHQAEKFIRRMVDTFQYVMSNQKAKLVSLREEIDFLKSYYYLLQVRFEDQLQLEINLPKNILDSLIPPMTLQLLVENAVKHNHVSKETPLLVYIRAKDNSHLVVSNTKTVTLKPVSSLNVGIENIKNRYRFFSDEKIIIRDDTEFTVQLPILKMIEKENDSLWLPA